MGANGATGEVTLSQEAEQKRADRLQPSRPALRYLGGKFLLRDWVIAHLPPHRVYVEPFGGAASVLLGKPRSYAEIYNDLDSDVVNLFVVLRDDVLSVRLAEQLRNTPFARAEFEASYVEAADPVERARRLVVRSFMGFGSDGCNPAVTTGFRSASNRSGTTPAHDWRNYADALHEIAERMRGVVIESRPAIQVMAAHDGPDTVHYVDPPYVHSTRSGKMSGGGRQHAYRHELSDADHVELLAFLRTLKGAVVLSGYPHPMYDNALQGWRRVERVALADGARPRREVLWINRSREAARPHAGPLFGAADV